MIRRLRIEVPATSANLGPGYDSFGLALGLVDTLELTVHDAPVDPTAVVTITGESAAEPPRDGSHLIVSVLREVLAEIAPDAHAERAEDHARMHQPDPAF